MVRQTPGSRHKNAEPNYEKGQQTVQTQLGPHVQKHVVAVVHDDVLICQIKIIRGINKAITVPAHTKGKFLDYPLSAFKIRHAQSYRRVTAITAADGFQTVQHRRSAHCQRCRPATQNGNKGLAAKEYAKSQQHYDAGHPVATRIGVQQAKCRQKTRH